MAGVDDSPEKKIQRKERKRRCYDQPVTSFRGHISGGHKMSRVKFDDLRQRCRAAELPQGVAVIAKE
jgi:hypothetical protein